MSMSRWLPIAIICLAVAAAYQLAKPTPVPAQQDVPSFNAGDAVNTRQLIPQRAIGDPPPPVKISGDARFNN